MSAFTLLAHYGIVEPIKEERPIGHASQLIRERQAADIGQQSLVFSQCDELPANTAMTSRSTEAPRGIELSAGRIFVNAT